MRAGIIAGGRINSLKYFLKKIARAQVLGRLLSIFGSKTPTFRWSSQDSGTYSSIHGLLRRRLLAKTEIKIRVGHCEEQSDVAIHLYPRFRYGNLFLSKDTGFQPVVVYYPKYKN
jgi:hypothetical protein